MIAIKPISVVVDTKDNRLQVVVQLPKFDELATAVIAHVEVRDYTQHSGGDNFRVIYSDGGVAIGDYAKTINLPKTVADTSKGLFIVNVTITGITPSQRFENDAIIVSQPAYNTAYAKDFLTKMMAVGNDTANQNINILQTGLIMFEGLKMALDCEDYSMAYVIWNKIINNQIDR